MKLGTVVSIAGLIGLSLASAVAWLFWGPVRQFCFSCVPTEAAHAWVGKLACVGLIGYFGGVAVPLFILAATVMFILILIKQA